MSTYRWFIRHKEDGTKGTQVVPSVPGVTDDHLLDALIEERQEKHGERWVEVAKETIPRAQRRALQHGADKALRKIVHGRAAR